MLMNKTATECGNILKYEIESIIDKFVPFKKLGKQSRKKHLSKEAIRKIVFKQTMWRVYRRTRKDEDYANYKEALNLATTEMRKSKRTFEKKLAGNIKNDSKSHWLIESPTILSSMCSPPLSYICQFYFKHIHTTSINTIICQFVPFIYHPL